MSTTSVRPTRGSAAAIDSASARSTNAAADGPDPDSHAANAPGVEHRVDCDAGVAGAGKPAVLVQAVFGRDPHGVDRARRERGDEQRGAADVEHGIVERHLFGEQPAGARGRRSRPRVPT